MSFRRARFQVKPNIIKSSEPKDINVKSPRGEDDSNSNASNDRFNIDIELDKEQNLNANCREVGTHVVASEENQINSKTDQTNVRRSRFQAKPNLKRFSEAKNTCNTSIKDDNVDAKTVPEKNNSNDTEQKNACVHSNESSRSSFEGASESGVVKNVICQLNSKKIDEEKNCTAQNDFISDQSSSKLEHNVPRRSRFQVKPNLNKSLESQNQKEVFSKENRNEARNISTELVSKNLDDNCQLNDDNISPDKTNLIRETESCKIPYEEDTSNNCTSQISAARKPRSKFKPSLRGKTNRSLVGADIITPSFNSSPSPSKINSKVQFIEESLQLSEKSGADSCYDNLINSSACSNTSLNVENSFIMNDESEKGNCFGFSSTEAKLLKENESLVKISNTDRCLSNFGKNNDSIFSNNKGINDPLEKISCDEGNSFDRTLKKSENKMSSLKSPEPKSIVSARSKYLQTKPNLNRKRYDSHSSVSSFKEQPECSGESSKEDSDVGYDSEKKRSQEKVKKHKTNIFDLDSSGEDIVVKEKKKKRNRVMTVVLTEPVDRSKMTVRDLIHSNPLSNPMTAEKSQMLTKTKKTSEVVLGTDSLQQKLKEIEPECTAVDDDAGDSIVPQIKIDADGNIVLNEDSVTVAAPVEDKTKDFELIHEDDFTNSPYGYCRKNKVKYWDVQETKKFYMALCAIGTDFSLMKRLFADRSRTDLKRKFKKEEKVNRALIDRVMERKRLFDEDFFNELSQLDLSRKSTKKQSKAKNTDKKNTKKNVKKADNADNENKERKPRKKRVTSQSMLFECSESETENNSNARTIGCPATSKVCKRMKKTIEKSLQNELSDNDEENIVTEKSISSKTHSKIDSLPAKRKAAQSEINSDDLEVLDISPLVVLERLEMPSEKYVKVDSSHTSPNKSPVDDQDEVTPDILEKISQFSEQVNRYNFNQNLNLFEEKTTLASNEVKQSRSVHDSSKSSPVLLNSPIKCVMEIDDKAIDSAPIHSAVEESTQSCDLKLGDDSHDNCLFIDVCTDDLDENYLSESNELSSYEDLKVRENASQPTSLSPKIYVSQEKAMDYQIDDSFIVDNSNNLSTFTTQRITKVDLNKQSNLLDDENFSDNSSIKINTTRLSTNDQPLKPVDLENIDLAKHMDESTHCFESKKNNENENYVDLKISHDSEYKDNSLIENGDHLGHSIIYDPATGSSQVCNSSSEDDSNCFFIDLSEINLDQTSSVKNNEELNIDEIEGSQGHQRKMADYSNKELSSSNDEKCGSSLSKECRLTHNLPSKFVKNKPINHNPKKKKQLRKRKYFKKRARLVDVYGTPEPWKNSFRRRSISEEVYGASDPWAKKKSSGPTWKLSSQQMETARNNYYESEQNLSRYVKDKVNDAETIGNESNSINVTIDDECTDNENAGCSIIYDPSTGLTQICNSSSEDEGNDNYMFIDLSAIDLDETSADESMNNEKVREKELKLNKYNSGTIPENNSLALELKESSKIFTRSRTRSECTKLSPASLQSLKKKKRHNSESTSLDISDIGSTLPMNLMSLSKIGGTAGLDARELGKGSLLFVKDENIDDDDNNSESGLLHIYLISDNSPNKVTSEEQNAQNFDEQIHCNEETLGSSILYDPSTGSTQICDANSDNENNSNYTLIDLSEIDLTETSCQETDDDGNNEIVKELEKYKERKKHSATFIFDPETSSLQLVSDDDDDEDDDNVFYFDPDKMSTE